MIANVFICQMADNWATKCSLLCAINTAGFLSSLNKLSVECNVGFVSVARGFLTSFASSPNFPVRPLDSLLQVMQQGSQFYLVY